MGESGLSGALAASGAASEEEAVAKEGEFAGVAALASLAGVLQEVQACPLCPEEVVAVEGALAGCRWTLGPWGAAAGEEASVKCRWTSGPLEAAAGEVPEEVVPLVAFEAVGPWEATEVEGP